MKKFFGFILLILFSINFTQATTSNPLIPRSVLFGLNDETSKAAVKISPDGSKLLFSSPVNAVYNLFICEKNKEGHFDIDTARQITFDKHQHIVSGTLMDNGTHILFKQDKNGDENHHLYLLEIATKKIVDLTPYEGVKVFGFSTDKKWPNSILMAMNKENPQVRDFYTLDITQELEWLPLTENPGDILSYIISDDWRVLGTMKMTEEGGREYHLRTDENKPFKKFIEWNMEDAEISSLLDFCEKDSCVYIIDAKDSNTGKLKKVNINTHKEELIAFDPEYEISSIFVHPDTKKLIAYSIEKDKTRPTILDEQFAQDYELLESLEEGELHITSMDNEMNTWICVFTYDNKLHNYYIYDRVNSECRFLCKSSTIFDPYSMVHMEPISYTARDGLTIHGYLSLPLGKTENIPLVVLVHGGPWVRDSWGLDPEVQWLCNRGYAVLQINYRGSSGYGKAFVDASNKEWGRAMHNDLIDGVDWAIEKGIADPEKVAIYGASYGGYAALAGAAFTPDTFCCSVDIFGISNILSHLAAYPSYWKPLLKRTKKRVGDPIKDEAMLKERSPLFSAHKIKKPLLIAQGKNDPRVKSAESEQIVEALNKNNCECNYVFFDDEGHGFSKHDNRLKFYAITEKFLTKHLGGRHEA